jgi:hypothetical protein
MNPNSLAFVKAQLAQQEPAGAAAVAAGFYICRNVGRTTVRTLAAIRFSRDLK